MTLFTLRSQTVLHILCTILIGMTPIFAQDEDFEEPATPDSIQTIETEEAGETSVESIPGAGGLEIGYKGYPWGSMITSMPSLAYMDSGRISNDTTGISMSGKLGLEQVEMGFFFGYGGFWKVEIDYSLNHDDVDEQVKLFTKIEKNLTEVYGPPKGTSQLLNGPSSLYTDAINVKYSRAFYRSSWNVTPVKVELILSGIVQAPKTDFPIIGTESSFLKLVYYNPDYMLVNEGDSDSEPLPSIFDIY